MALPKIGKRHLVALWLFSGFVNVYILRVSINVAIVSMVNSTQAEPSGNQSVSNHTDADTCPAPEKTNSTAPARQGEFNWDHATQGIILSSFYYGYICTQFVGGFMARRVGARILYGVGVGGTAALTLLNPIAARTSPAFLTALRVAEGFMEGVTFPSSHYLLGNWAPKEERTLMVSFPLSGPNIGTVLAAPLTGLLCEYGFDGGWASSFYIFGSISLLWCVGWFYCIRDTPAQHSTISAEERAYIEERCQSSAKPVSFKQVPWKAMATSPAVWAIIIAHTAYNWNFYTVLTETSTYLKDVLHIPTAIDGLVTSLPYICIWILQVVAALLADVFRKKGMKTKNVRKLSYVFGMLSSAACLIAISFVGCNIPVVLTLLCLAVGLSGFGLSGMIVNHVDIAPQYAGILMGITNTFATVPGIVSPILAGAITNEESTIATWRTVFFISAGVSVVGAVLFALLADGEVQPWAVVGDGAGSEVSDVKGLVNPDNQSTDKTVAKQEEHEKVK